MICAGCGIKFLAHKSRQDYHRNLYCTRDCYQTHGNISTPFYIHNERYEKLRQRLCKHASYLRWKKKVLIRDGYKCTDCGNTQKLRVHHVLGLNRIVYKYNPTLSLDKMGVVLDSAEFNDYSNGKTLCISCHMKEHHNSPLTK